MLHLFSRPVTMSPFFSLRRFLASAASSGLKVIPASEASSKKWQIMVAVCLERFPIVAPQLTELEMRYEQMLRMIEDEKSLLSHHELRREAERRAAKKSASRKELDATDERQIVTAQDFEDASIAERKRFTVAPRLADDSNVQSMTRLSDKKLVLLVKSPFGPKDKWDIPGAILQENETLAEAAHRALEGCLDISPEAIFYGNAPRKFYKYNYPRPVMEKTGADGAKLFLFKAELPQRAKLTPLVDRYSWVSKEELGTLIQRKRYRRCISSFIFE